jgi:3-methyladenine DNA glycosylase AlkC
MSELLLKVLTDKSTRTTAQLPVIAASGTETFVPWSNSLE